MLRLDDANVLEWLAILIKHRIVRYSSPVEKRAEDYIIANYSIDISKSGFFALFNLYILRSSNILP